MKKKAILVVSFGTGFRETREKTIDAVTAELAGVFPDRTLYTAWSSPFLIKKVLKSEGLKIASPEEAMEAMAADGIEDVVVQPTEFFCGHEYNHLLRAATEYKDRFESLRLGRPLVTDSDDVIPLVNALKVIFEDISRKKPLLLMGHGSAHLNSSIYDEIERVFRADRSCRMTVAALEGTPRLEEAVEVLKGWKTDTVVMAPMMLVAGRHARIDMAGDSERSWKNRLRKEGIESECIIKGLGEYPEIRRLYCSHAERAVKL